MKHADLKEEKEWNVRIRKVYSDLVWRRDQGQFCIGAGGHLLPTSPDSKASWKNNSYMELVFFRCWRTYKMDFSVMKGLMGQSPPPRIFGLEPLLLGSGRWCSDCGNSSDDCWLLCSFLSSIIKLILNILVLTVDFLSVNYSDRVCKFIRRLHWTTKLLHLKYCMSKIHL